MPSRRGLALLSAYTAAVVKDEEVPALLTAFWGFFSILSGYFLLLPLRDEAGISLGTHHLPKLFAASLLLTLLATPLASFFLNRHPARERGLRHLYRALSLLVLVFCCLYLLTGAPGQRLPGVGDLDEEDPEAARAERALLHVLPVQAAAAQAVLGDSGSGGEAEEQGLALSSGGRGGEGGRHVVQREGGEGSRRRQLLPDPKQHQQQHQQKQEQKQQAERGEQAGREAAGGAGSRDSAERAHAHPAGAGAVALSPAQRAVRVAFFLSASLLNLVAVSSWWARAADVFSAEAAARLFGIMGAGATLGQLCGSVMAATLARAPLLRTSPTSPSLLPLLLSAGMLAAAGQCAGRFHSLAAPLPSRAASRRDSAATPHEPGRAPSRLGPLSAASFVEREEEGGGSGGAAKPPLARGQSSIGRRPGERAGLGHTLASTAQGFALIVRSAYLRHLCLFLILNYVVSSFFYFEKSLVVATAVRDAASRTAWFAAINSASAFCILGLQLLATGPILRYLGVSRALAVTPAAAALLMAGVALNPTPNSVGLAEVLRKVLTYSLARPAREVLFTVVSRDEKYKAKIFIDTVVQRCGDTLAAGAFQALEGSLGFGPSGVALAAVPVCCAWAGVALALGRRQERLAAGARRKQEEASGTAGVLVL